MSVPFRLVVGRPPAELDARLHEKFDLRGKDYIVTYGDTVYASGPLPDDLIVHEAVHVKQQAEYGDKDRWWDRYLMDTEFRLMQELEAYRRQWRYIKQHEKDRNRATMHLHRIAGDLASSMYGNLLTWPEAKRMIQSGA